MKSNQTSKLTKYYINKTQKLTKLTRLTKHYSSIAILSYPND